MSRNTTDILCSIFKPGNFFSQGLYHVIKILITRKQQIPKNIYNTKK